MPRGYFAGGAGLALGAGEGEAAGAGAALPAVAAAAGAGPAAAADWGWAPGLIQQTWMRLERVSATLGSIWAAKPVIEVEVPEGSIEVIKPHQAYDAAAEPDAFGIAGRAVNGLRRLDEFVGLALVVLVDVGGVRGRRLAGLILGCRAAALGKRARRSDQEGQACSGEAPQNRNSWIKQPSTHTFPDEFPAARAAGVMSGLLPPKFVPNAADISGDSHAGYFRFCPAKSQLYRCGGKTAAGDAAE